MADMETKITNGISGAAERILTATDISDGYVNFDFQSKSGDSVGVYLVPAVTLKSADGVLKPMTNFKIENEVAAGNVKVTMSGSAVAEVSTVAAVADVAGALDGKYFTLNSTTTSYYVWMNVDAGGNDPAPGGTGIAVAVTTGDDADTVAAAIQTAVDANGAFGATVTDNVVTITNAVAGAATDITAGDSGFTVATVTEGQGAIGEVTAIAGDILSCVVQPRYPYRDAVLA